MTFRTTRACRPLQFEGCAALMVAEGIFGTVGATWWLSGTRIGILDAFLCVRFGVHPGPGVIGLMILASVALVDVRIHVEFLWCLCSRYHWYCSTLHFKRISPTGNPDFV